MVSVCMATYNGERFIREQLESILRQLKPEDEIVISDDSSSDRTIDIIRSIGDNRVRIFINQDSRNLIKNFQNCLINARGALIFLADQDDVWIDGKYSKMVGLLKDYDLVVSDSIVVDENLEKIVPSFFDFFGSGKGILKNILQSSYYGSCMAFRKELLAVSLPFPDTKEIGHDLWIGLVGELTGKVLFYNEPLILYRRHASAFTSTGFQSSGRNIFEKAFGRVVMIKEVARFLLSNGKRTSINNNADV